MPTVGSPVSENELSSNEKESLSDNLSFNERESLSVKLHPFTSKPMSNQSLTAPNQLSPDTQALVDSSSYINKAAILLGTKSNTVVDPGSILKWIDIIKSLLGSCPKNAPQLIQAGRDERLIHRRILVNHILREFPEISRNEALNRAYQIFESAAKASLSDMQALVNEI